MPSECAHTYPDGRRCRRIPKSGKAFCPGHHPRRRPDEYDPDFVREMRAWVEQLHDTPLEPLLVLLQESLAAVQPVLERKVSRAHRAVFIRSTIAVTHSIDRLQQEMAAYHALALRSHNGPPPAPSSREEVIALGEMLLRALPSYIEPQLP